MTVDDLRAPGLKSGFKNVAWQHDKKTRPYHSQVADALGKRKNWYGPWRATGEEAAQDYLDYVASRSSNPSIPVSLKTAGHAYNIEKTDKDPEVEAALGVLRDARAQRQGKQGFIYCIIEEFTPTHCKIGYSVNPDKRVAELQTGNPRKLQVYATKPGTLEDEKALHAKYIKDNILQEWFVLSDELFDEFQVKEKI